MEKVKIINITDQIYTLENEDKNIYKKAFQFMNTKYIPNIGDIITIDESILEENNIYTFGDIYNKNKEDIIKIDSNNSIIYLQRYYG